jgi:3-oxoacyl-[acyl-carrier-protein] synthase II
MRDSAVVTGCGAVTSVGTSAAATWSAVRAGTSGLRAFTMADAQVFGAPVSGIDADTLGVGSRDAWIMGLPALMLLGSAREAMAEAGLDPSACGPDEIGFFAGMGMVDPAPADLRAAALASRGPEGIDYRRFFGDGYREIHPLWPLAMLNNVGFCLSARLAGVRGENAVFSPGADSALLALSEASDTVVSGRAAAALAAGASERVSAASVTRARILGGWDAPECRCAPGECAAVLVVESADSARARGAVPLAAVPGWGFSSAVTASEGFAAAMTLAVERARREARPVDAVILHDERCGGVDSAEREAVAVVLGAQPTPPALLSSKRLLGHCLAGGSAADAVLAVRMLAEGVLPQPLAQPARAPGRPGEAAPDRTAVRPRRIVVNSRSWSGSYGSVVLDVME